MRQMLAFSKIGVQYNSENRISTSENKRVLSASK